MPMARCGTNDCSVHRGQVGQPSPDPVSRTAPPVTTMSPLATTLARAIRETVAGVTAARRSWAERADTAPMLLTRAGTPARPDDAAGGRVTCISGRPQVRATL